MYSIFLSTCVCLAAVTLSPKESFFLRRITEYWKDKDFAIVKQQISEFLSTHSESGVNDNLLAILGDLYFQEENFPEALATYEKIKGDEFREKTLYKHILCLYKNKDWPGIVAAALPFYTNGREPNITFKEEIQFVLAESLYGELQNCPDEDQKLLLARDAKELYLRFTSSTYKDQAIFPLAELHRMLKEYPQACCLYLILAEKYQDKTEELLFQVAVLQTEFDKKAAIDTYGKIYQLGKTRAGDAAYNQFVLLFQNSYFSELTSQYMAISQRLPRDKMALFHFCVGKSFFALEDYSKAIQFLEQYVLEEKENSDYKKNAFLTLINCAQKANDISLFDRTLQQLLEAYPSDIETAKALLLHAQTSIQKDMLVEATADLQRVVEQFPQYEQKEAVLYDRALLLSQVKNWTESRKAFFAYLEQFPSSAHAEVIWSYILNCSIQQLKQDGSKENRQLFASDLKMCLRCQNLFSQNERPNYQFLLGKTLFELEDYKTSIEEFEHYLTAYPQHSSVAEAHLILALCDQRLFPNSNLFIEHAEKALALNPNLPDRDVVHLQLFNHYLLRNETEKAAEHLYEYYIALGLPIQTENQVWLANHYYNQVKEGRSDSGERATLLFQKLLRIEDDKMHPQINPATAFLEVEALKLADLYSLLDQADKRITLLTALTQMQEKNTSIGWKFQRQALYDLGRSYEALDQNEKALEIYESLIRSSSHAPSYFSYAAVLQRARLLFAKCSEENRREGTPEMTEILNSLKDLQLQKKLFSEPIHLEAALEYADIRTSLSPPDTRDESALFFLNRIKENYYSSDDKISQEYQESRARYPDKDMLFQNYMKCIEAEMLRLEAVIAKKENQLDKARQSERVATALLEEVLSESQALTPYLRSRTEHNLKAFAK